jgi:hypothetical protein
VLPKANRFDHPELAFTHVQVVPLSIDRQVSFRPSSLLMTPPMSTMLLSGSTTVEWSERTDHPELAFTCVQVIPLSTDRQVSFVLSRSTPPVRMMLPSGIATFAKS